MAYIDNEIIEARKSNTILLDKEIKKINQEQDFLCSLKGSLLSLNPEFGIRDIDSSINKLELEKSKITNIKSRWESGVIKIAVAGLEKAGKTTFLNNIINGEVVTLPAFAERCTATLCEIKNSEKEKSVLSFFSEATFLKNIIIPDIEELNRDRNLEKKIDIPNSITSFNRIKLPDENIFNTGTSSRMILSRLRDIQSKSGEFQGLLGHPNKEIDIKEVKDWVAHKEGTSATNPKSIAIERCTVYTKIADGNEPLMLLDTPGVNDPNPRARRRTLELVEKEADLLLLMSRPRNQPSPTAEFQNFVNDIRSFDSSVSVQDFQLYILNDDKGIRDSSKYLETHKRLLMEEPYAIPSEKIIEVDAMDGDSIKKCFTKINEFLSQNLKARDRFTVQKICESIYKVEAGILELLESISRNIPADCNDVESAVPIYNAWFDEFWGTLIAETKNLISVIRTDPAILKYHTVMMDKFHDVSVRIVKELPTEQELINRAGKTEDLIPNQIGSIDYAVPQINKLLNEITDSVKDFSNIVQSRFVELISKTQLSILLKGDDDKSKIRNLVALFKEIFYGTDISDAGIKSLEEILNSSDSIDRIFRWELRPAVYCVNAQYREMYPVLLKNRIDRLYSRYPSGKDEGETKKNNGKVSLSDKSVRGNIIQAVKMIERVLKNQQYDFGEVAEDIIGNWFFSMVYGKKSVWRDCLLKERNILVPKLSESVKNTRKNKEIRTIINNISTVITSK